MSTAAEVEQPPEGKSKKGLIIGLVLALAGAGGGFYAMYSGAAMSLFGGDSQTAEGDSATTAADDGHGTGDSAAPAPNAVGFVPLEPITISLGPRGQSRHLRFSAQLEVAPAHAAEVRHLMPRIMDVLNIYLRALDPHELEEPAALLRLRGQMLRRVQIVTGPGFVNDLLVMEFVLN
ncbi:flagellar basal body-associated FliL family protein [Pararhodobacter oceanensis]|uniref:flagellar basal body-associated FliL family protein n=1 Tax=Pararhodobacter oceanensis TaxID=2172121 RepID=UPI003A935F1D